MQKGLPILLPAMTRPLSFLSLILSLLILTGTSCRTSWTKVIQYGKVSQEEFSETVEVEIQQGLIFFPVEINGKSYRFLFDSGAPFSISHEIQEEFDYPVISRGRIVDSDKNRSMVQYVQVDTIQLGSIPFLEQTAFVADFTSNPLLECLNIDGIVGSNLMRHANWSIDQIRSEIMFSHELPKEVKEECIPVPFRTDLQYNVLLDLEMGSVTVKDFMMDYGSNGPISIPSHAMDILEELQEVDGSFRETGIKQSGIIGEPVSLDRRIAYMESVDLDGLNIHDVELRTSRSRLIGNALLARYIVHIDWDEHYLYFCDEVSVRPDHHSLGFRLGTTDDGGIYVRSVLQGSDASAKGLEPGMLVLKYEDLDFRSGDGLCDYVTASERRPEAISIQVLDERGKLKELRIEKKRLGELLD